MTMHLLLLISNFLSLVLILMQIWIYSNWKWYYSSQRTVSLVIDIKFLGGFTSLRGFKYTYMHMYWYPGMCGCMFSWGGGERFIISTKIYLEREFEKR